MIIGLPPSMGLYRAIWLQLTVSQRQLTSRSYLHIIPLSKVAELFTTTAYKLHGFPWSIISD